jgi:hypothetical protein
MSSRTVTIDPEKVHDGLLRSRKDFTDFQLEILAWLDALA